MLKKTRTVMEVSGRKTRSFIGKVAWTGLAALSPFLMAARQEKTNAVELKNGCQWEMTPSSASVVCPANAVQQSCKAIRERYIDKMRQQQLMTMYSVCKKDQDCQLFINRNCSNFFWAIAVNDADRRKFETFLSDPETVELCAYYQANCRSGPPKNAGMGPSPGEPVGARCGSITTPNRVAPPLFCRVKYKSK